MKFLSKKELEKLTTRRLLAYKRMLWKEYQCLELFELDEFDKTKETLLEILGKREHINGTKSTNNKCVRMLPNNKRVRKQKSDRVRVKYGRRSDSDT